MSIPTVQITTTIRDPSGAAVSGAKVSALLSSFDMYGGEYIYPTVIQATANGSGAVTLTLFPNALGAMGTYYRITAKSADGKKTYITTTVYVPNENSSLDDIAGTLPSSSEQIDAIDYILPITQGGTGARTAAGAAANLGLTIGTDVQAHDATLDALAGVSSAADTIPYFTGSDAASVTSLTSYARSLIAAASAAAARTVLGLGLLATVTAGSANQLTGMDAVGSGQEWKTLQGTSNQVSVSHGIGTITLSTPQSIGTASSPTFAGLTISGATASRLLATDGSKTLASVSSLTSWIAGTSNQVTVTDDGDGSVTLSLPQSIATGSSPTFSGLTLTTLTSSGLTKLATGSRLVVANTTDNGVDALQVTGSGTFSGAVTIGSVVNALTLTAPSDDYAMTQWKRGSTVIAQFGVGSGGEVVLNAAGGSGTKQVFIQVAGSNIVNTTASGLAVTGRSEAINNTDYQFRAGIAGYTTQYYDFGRNASTGLLTFYGAQTGYTGYVFSGVDGERARIDASGNFGLRVTPSPWGSGMKALDIGAGSALVNAGSNVSTWLAANAYYGSDWRYKNTEAAALYEIDGSHKWHIAASGTAGNAISFTRAMTLNASGRLLLGTTTDDGTSLAQIAGKLLIGGAIEEISRFRGQAGVGSYSVWYDASSSVSRGYIGYGDTLFGSGGLTNFGIRSEGNLILSASSLVRGVLTGSGWFSLGTGSAPSYPLHFILGSNSGDYVGWIENTTASNPYGFYFKYTNAAPNSSASHFQYFSDSSTGRYYVRSDGGIGNYQANNVNLSDLSTKRDFKLYSDDEQLIANAWEFGKRMRSAWGRFKYLDQTHDDFNNGYGAQYVRTAADGLFPELVDELEWGKDSAGKPIMRLSVYDSDLMHLVGVNVTELQFRSEDHEEKIESLLAWKTKAEAALAAHNITIN